jgi:hypothetical protein
MFGWTLYFPPGGGLMYGGVRGEIQNIPCMEEKPPHLFLLPCFSQNIGEGASISDKQHPLPASLGGLQGASYPVARGWRFLIVLGAIYSKSQEHTYVIENSLSDPLLVFTLYLHCW